MSNNTKNELSFDSFEISPLYNRNKLSGSRIVKFKESFNKKRVDLDQFKKHYTKLNLERFGVTVLKVKKDKLMMNAETQTMAASQIIEVQNNINCNVVLHNDKSQEFQNNDVNLPILEWKNDDNFRKSRIHHKKINLSHFEMDNKSLNLSKSGIIKCLNDKSYLINNSRMNINKMFRNYFDEKEDVLKVHNLSILKKNINLNENVINDNNSNYRTKDRNSLSEHIENSKVESIENFNPKNTTVIPKLSHFYQNNKLIKNYDDNNGIDFFKPKNVYYSNYKRNINQNLNRIDNISSYHNDVIIDNEKDLNSNSLNNNNYDKIGLSRSISISKLKKITKSVNFSEKIKEDIFKSINNKRDQIFKETKFKLKKIN